MIVSFLSQTTPTANQSSINFSFYFFNSSSAAKPNFLNRSRETEISSFVKNSKIGSISSFSSLLVASSSSSSVTQSKQCRCRSYRTEHNSTRLIYSDEIKPRPTCSMGVIRPHTLPTMQFSSATRRKICCDTV